MTKGWVSKNRAEFFFRCDTFYYPSAYVNTNTLLLPSINNSAEINALTLCFPWHNYSCARYWTDYM